MLFNFNKVFASDYQYKILDPKYNPAAEKLLNGELQAVEDSEQTETQKGFDYLHFLAILAAISFPIFVFVLSWKSFRHLMDSIPGCNTDETPKQTIGNIKISENDSYIEPDENYYKLEQFFENSINNTVNEDIFKNAIEEKISSKQVVEKPITQDLPPKDTPAQAPESVITEKLLDSINNQFENTNVATIPIEKKNPILLNTAPLTKNKGLCLVEYDKKYSLIGYINTKIFFLNKFDSIKSNEIRPRLTEKNEGKDRYLIRLGSYKSLIEVSDDEMNLLINL